MLVFILYQACAFFVDRIPSPNPKASESVLRGAIQKLTPGTLQGKKNRAAKGAGIYIYKRVKILKHFSIYKAIYRFLPIP